MTALPCPTSAMHTTRAPLLILLAAALAVSACNVADFPSATAACRATASEGDCKACCTAQKANSTRFRQGKCECRLFYWFHEQ